MPSEQAALLRIAEKRGEAEYRAAAQRLAAGSTLVSEQWGRPFGEISRGSLADLIVVPVGAQRPRHVIVGGRLVVEDGVLKTGDLARIRSDAEREAERLWQRMAGVA
jgi:adenine deaminase